MTQPLAQRRGNPGIRRSPEDGYTLIELLIVLTIISLIVGVVGPHFLRLSRRVTRSVIGHAGRKQSPNRCPVPAQSDAISGACVRASLEGRTRPAWSMVTESHDRRDIAVDDVSAGALWSGRHAAVSP
jgi:prepilin-type N-terminal cleavage/methylation domain-containing protein